MQNLKNKNKKKQKTMDKTLTTIPRKLQVPCHYGNVAVTKTPFPLYGAGYSRGFHRVKDAIVIDLADVILEPKVMFWNMEIPPELDDRYSPECGVIRIQWPDGGVPRLSPLFWHRLADFLELQNKTVVVTCMGGHGRTGTCLAILCGIYRIHGTSDIGEFVRSRHCSHAIETYSQVDYIEEVLGEKTLVKPSWAHEMEVWKNWKSTNVSKEDEVLMDSHQKVFGYFDKNDVYHTGYPPKDSEPAIVVSHDDEGNDVFEYIYDKDSGDFLQTY
jgi:hypothetical protein